MIGAAVGVLLQLSAAQVPLDVTELSGGIAGRVCRDLDGDGSCSASEPGVPGARLVLENGQTVRADAAGRYHFGAVGARVPGARGPGRLLPGRHRVRLDTRSLAPGETVDAPGLTVEVPMAGLVVRDFAVRSAARPAGATLGPAPADHAPAAVLQPRGIRFLLAGTAAPGDRVTVAATAAEVDARGVYRAWVELKPGSNVVPLTVESPGGAVRLVNQRVDVVERAGGYLVIPRPAQESASLQLPGGSAEPAASGPGAIRIEGAPGTKISSPQGQVTVDASGVAQLPVVLLPGKNAVALRIERPDQPPREERLEIPAVPRPLLAGLLDLEAAFSPATGGLRLFGRGAAHGEVRLGSWELSGELDLRDEDLDALRADPAALALPRTPERLERWIDPERAPITWADDATELSPNAAEGRLRAELRHDRLGRFGYGTHRGQLVRGELGRFERLTFGPFAELEVPLGADARVSAEAFFSPGAADPLRGVATLPVHDERIATGGSLYYLSSGSLAEGSETVRVEVRDALSGIPLGERHLVRGRDYEIDYLAGRVLLARPLSFLTGAEVLRSLPLTASPEQVLVIDAERLVLGTSFQQVAGGEARGRLGPVELAVGAADQRGGATGTYQLGHARASVAAGPLSVHIEGAASRGAPTAAQDFTLSEDGGLGVLAPAAGSFAAAEGGALNLRVRGPGLGPRGRVDLVASLRTPGYADRATVTLVRHRQLAVHAEQPVGAFVVAALADVREGQDPRTPFEARSIAARRLGGSFGYRGEAFEARVEVDDAQLEGALSAVDATQVAGARTAAGAFARYRFHPAFAVSASHRQVLSRRGEGPGAFDDTFSAAGVEVALPKQVDVALRGGWGPRLGPLAWLEAQRSDGPQTYYGAYSVDVDGPDVGQRQAVSGARTEPGDGSTVFVEDVAAHDAASVRLSRAVGFSQQLGGGLEVSGRYEHGARHPLGGQPSLRRDAGGASAAWIGERVRLQARAELRREVGTAMRGAAGAIDRLQRVGSAAAEWRIAEPLRFSARLNYADTTGAAGLEARLLEGAAALAWRFERGMVVGRYGARRELLPGDRGAFGERTLQTLSLMPALNLRTRFTLGAGAHAGWSTQAGNTGLVLSGSLRPAVRVVGGLELGAEVAARSATPDGGEWLSLRGEAGWRFGETMMLAVGYTVFGFSGLGVGDPADARQDRVYLRAELAY